MYEDLSETRAAHSVKFRITEQLCRYIGWEVFTPVLAPIQEVVANLDQHDERIEVLKMFFFAANLLPFKAARVLRLRQRDCGQSREGKSHNIFAITGNLVYQISTVRDFKARSVTLYPAKLAKIHTVNGPSRFVRRQLFSELTVVEFAEVVLIEVVVHQRAEIHQAIQGQAFIAIESLTARPRDIIQCRNAQTAKGRARSILPESEKTGNHSFHHKESPPLQ
jgi:hypothetical protein